MGGRSGQNIGGQNDQNKLQNATNKLNSLPNGKIFDDAKSIVGIFDKSERSWSEVIEAYEKNQQNAIQQVVDVRNIHITQPNIQSGKVIDIMKNIENVPIVNVVQFENGEMAIYDGHHRVTANYLLGDYKLLVNIVKL